MSLECEKDAINDVSLNHTTKNYNCTLARSVVTGEMENEGRIDG